MGPLAKNELIFLFNQLLLCRRVASQSLNLTVIQKAENLVSPLPHEQFRHLFIRLF